MPVKPCLEERISIDLPKSALQSEELDKEPGSILVVDDEEHVLGAISDFFASRGFSVSTALNGRQALALVSCSSFSVMICDLRLPDINGVQLLEKVLEVDPDVVFVMMTGFASVQSAVNALKKGAYDYVVKPFSMFDLEKTVRLGLEHKRLARENLELSHLMRKLLELDQIKSNIISTVSHEFRTPLTSLKGYLTMLLQGTDNKPRGNAEKIWLKAMIENVNRLETLVLNLLLMTESSSGGICLVEDNTRIVDLINECIVRVQPLTRSKNIEVIFDFQKEIVIRADGEKLGLALTNLLENAVKFNLEDGKVDVSLREKPDSEGIEIVIRDTGIGIPENKIQSLFESFTQDDMTHTRKFSGAGLGLPVAKAIIEAHGGRIDLSSDPGMGSEIRVWLPKSK